MVVVRDRDVELRAFVNVCRHRGHLVVRDSGCRETLQCPYHAWTYGLDGSLRRARAPSGRRASMRRRSRSCPSRSTRGARSCSSTRIQARLRSPRRSVSCPRSSSAAASTSHAPLPLPPRVADRGELEGRARELPRVLPLPRRASRLQQGDRRRPGLLRAVGVAHVLEPDRAHPRLGPGGPRSAPYVPEGDVTQSQYHLLWPNTTINIAPGPQNIALERWVPDGARHDDRGHRLLVRCRRAARDRAGGARLRRQVGRRTSTSSSRCRRGSTRARCRRAG